MSFSFKHIFFYFFFCFYCLVTNIGMGCSQHVICYRLVWKIHNFVERLKLRKRKLLKNRGAAKFPFFFIFFFRSMTIHTFATFKSTICKIRATYASSLMLSAPMLIVFIKNEHSLFDCTENCEGCERTRDSIYRCQDPRCVIYCSDFIVKWK